MFNVDDSKRPAGSRKCPKCGGKGVILPEDPLMPAVECACKRVRAALPVGLPLRYANVTLDSFFKWWYSRDSTDVDTICDLYSEHQRPGNLEFHKRLEQAWRGLGRTSIKDVADLGHSLGLGEEEIQVALNLRTMVCAFVTDDHGGKLSRKYVLAGLEPLGMDSLRRMLGSGATEGDFFWITGDPQTGKTSLAAATMKAWSEKVGKPGVFVDVRDFTMMIREMQNLRNANYTTIEERIDPFLEAPFLVLDDVDALSAEPRVLHPFMLILNHRYANMMPTLLTSKRPYPKNDFEMLGSIKRFRDPAESHIPFGSGEATPNQCIYKPWAEGDPSVAKRLYDVKRLTLTPAFFAYFHQCHKKFLETR